MVFQNMYFDDYPKVSGKEYWACKMCGLSDNVIGARIYNHLRTCEWRIANIPREMAMHQAMEDARAARQFKEVMQRLTNQINLAGVNARVEIHKSFDEARELLKE